MNMNKPDNDEGFNLEDYLPADSDSFENHPSVESPSESSEVPEVVDKSPGKRRKSKSSSPASKAVPERRLSQVHLYFPSDIAAYLRICSSLLNRSMSDLVSEILREGLKKYHLPDIKDLQKKI